MNVDVDKMIRDFKEHGESAGAIIVQENGEDKLICLFALPHLIKEVESFGKTIINQKK